MSTILPDCMMPDGADPCAGYAQLRERAERAEAERDALHAAICQAVTVMNVGDHRRGHEILRQALIDYADAALRERS